jgi:drug/metabolite transporter (DMT)-like permease
VTAVLVAGIPVAAGVAAGERPSPLAGVGILIALVAVVLVSREAKHEGTEDVRRFTPRVARLTIGAGAFFGLSFVATGSFEPGAGLWPLLVARCVASAIVYAIGATRGILAPPRGSVLLLALCVGALDVIAIVAMLYAFQSGQLSLQSVIVSLYPAVTVGLAVTALRERVVGFQIAGLVLSAAAIALIAVAG